MSVTSGAKIALLLLIWICIGVHESRAQSVGTTGTVSDTLGTPLPGANVLAIPDSQGVEVGFSFADAHGRYRIKLRAGVAYRMEATHLGYAKKVHTLVAREDTTLNFAMKTDVSQLQGITVTETRVPVTVREDTITYRADSFVDGRERKLREVLMKLPGVEVDREGNVHVNGKKVNQLLVEGEPFFTGDTKLGVNNIPADAVDEVEVLDRYTPVAFMKGLIDSDKMAMNIKLKEDKTRFVFGDVEAGGGVEDLYLFHPSLFYYSPGTQVNFIGDINNTGRKSFGMKDYINFEGGIAQLMSRQRGRSAMSSGELFKYLGDEQTLKDKNALGGVHVAQRLGIRTKLSTYVLANAGSSRSLSETQNAYFQGDGSVAKEMRNTSRSSDHLFGLGKIALTHIPRTDASLHAEIPIKVLEGRNHVEQTSSGRFENSRLDDAYRSLSWESAPFVEYNRKFSPAHVLRATARLNPSDRLGNGHRTSSDSLFPGRLPLEGSAPFDSKWDRHAQNTEFFAQARYYWIRSAKDHISPGIGYSYAHRRYNTTDYQALGEIQVPYTPEGFDNRFVFELHDPFLGLQYKLKAGKWVFGAGAEYHLYSWATHQRITDEQTPKSNTALLPELSLKWNIMNSERLTLGYRRTSEFGDAAQYADRLHIDDFNTLSRGNHDLENVLTDAFHVGYRKSKMFKKWFFHAYLTYAQVYQPIHPAVEIKGIDRTLTAGHVHSPDRRWKFNTAWSKAFGPLKTTVGLSGDLSTSHGIINGAQSRFTSENLGYNLRLETRFDRGVNFHVAWIQNRDRYGSDDLQDRFVYTLPSVGTTCFFFDAFDLIADWQYHHTVNERTGLKVDYGLLDASLRYRAENVPWTFAIVANNLTDVEFIRESSFDAYVVSDRRTNIRPRTLLLTVSYKL